MTIEIWVVGGMFVTNVVGWIYTGIKNKNDASKREGRIDQQLSSLPCITNPNYQTKLGALGEKVEGLDGRVERIEDTLNHEK